jgi:adenylate cyclase
VNKSGLVLGLSLLAGIMGLRFIDPPLLQNARLMVFDLYQEMHPRPYLSAPVKIVDIDDGSLSKFGQWPWPRSLIAELVDRLAEAGAAAICFDIVFAEPDHNSPRQYLQRLTRDALPRELLDHIGKFPDFDERLAASMQVAPVVLGFAGSVTPGIRQPKLLSGFARVGGDPLPGLVSVDGAVTNLEILEQVASGQGGFTLGSSDNAVVRRVPLLLNVAGQLYPALSVEAMRVALGASTLVLRASGDQADDVADRASIMQSIRIADLQIPVTADGQLWLHFTEPVAQRTVSAATVLTQTKGQNRDLLAGQVVLIGTSAMGLQDIHATPLASFESGLSIHAQALEQMLLGWFLARPDWADAAELLMILISGAGLLWLLLRSGAVWSAVFGLVAVSAGIVASWVAFTEYRFLLDPVYPSIAATAVYLAVTFQGYLQTEREKRQVREAFRTYLAPALVDQLLESPQALSLGGEARQLTFLFTDIAGFTAFTEKCEPGHLVALLNDYLDQMCSIVMAHGGTIDKIVGDAIHAMFNAPLDQPDHAQRAVNCALALDQASQVFVQRHSTESLVFGQTRIGVNTGVAIVGNFGGHRRFDYTAHGDAINTAARLESANKHLGTRICVAASTAVLCAGQQLRPIGRLKLVGKSQLVEVFLPLRAGEAEPQLLTGYDQLYVQLRQGEAGAAQNLASLLERYPDDPLIRLHAERLRRGEVGVDIRLEGK